MKKLAMLAVIALVSALAFGALSANAAKVKKFPTSVTINYHAGTYGDSFDGKVKSPKRACRRGRTVQVKLVLPGPDQIIGTDQSDAQGNWEVDAGGFAASGAYYARAKKKKLRPRRICRKAKSPIVLVP